MEGKTIKEWLEGIEDKKVRGQALKNTNKAMLKIEELSLFAALEGAFSWRNTLEGHDYWERIAKEA